MNNTGGALDFELLLNDDRFRAAVRRAVTDLQGLGATAQNEGNRMDGMMRKMQMLAAGYFSLQGMKQFAMQVVNVRGEFQQLEVAFSTILRSKEKANELMAQMVDLAARTPFTLQDVAGGAKQLLAYGTNVKDVTTVLTRLGNVASGVSMPLGDLIYLYGTAQTQGQIYQRDIIQFAGRGIPIYAELAKVLKINQNEVKEFVSAGKVGMKEIEQVFKNMTSEGGMFFNLMEAQSKTVTGQISNLKDKISMMFNAIGKDSEGVIYKSISGLATLVEHYEEIGKVLLSLVATYGTYKAAIIVNNVVMAVQKEMAIGYTAAQALQYRALLATEKAQKLLNRTMLNNPYVAIATGLAMVVTSLLLFRKRTDELIEVGKDFQKTLAAEQANLDAIFELLNNTKEGTKEHSDTVNQANGVLGKYNITLLNESSNIRDIANAYDQATAALQKNLALESKSAEIKDKTTKLWDTFEKTNRRFVSSIKEAGKEATQTTVVQMVNDAVKKDLVTFQKMVTTAYTVDPTGMQRKTEGITDEARKKISDLSKTTGIGYNQMLDYVKGYSTYLTRQTEVSKNINDYYAPFIAGFKGTTGELLADVELQKKSISDLENDLAKFDAAAKKREAETGEKYEPSAWAIARIAEIKRVIAAKEAELRNEAEINARIDNLKTRQKELKDIDPNKYKRASEDPRYIAIQKSIDLLENQLPQKTKKAAEKEQKAVAGSIEAYRELLSAKEKALGNLPYADKDYDKKAKALVDEIASINKKIQEIEFNTQPIDKQIEYTKSQYEAYYRWVKFEGKDAADAQYSELLKNGKDFEEYLQKLNDDIEKKISLEPSGKGKNKLREEQIIIKYTIEGQKSVETQLENFKGTLSSLRTEAASTAEYLANLLSLQENLSRDFTQAGQAKYSATTDEIENVRKNLEEAYKGILANVDAFMKRYDEATRMFTSEREQLVVDLPTLNDEQILDALGEIEKARKMTFGGIEADLTQFKANLTLLFGDLNSISQDLINYAGGITTDAGKGIEQAFTSIGNPKTNDEYFNSLKKILDLYIKLNKERSDGMSKDKELVDSLIANYQSTANKVKKIEEDKNEKIKALDKELAIAVKNGDKDRIDSILDTRNQVIKAYQDESEKMMIELSNEGKYFDKYYQLLLSYGKKYIKDIIKNTKKGVQDANDVLEKMKASGASDEAIKKQQQIIDELVKNIKAANDAIDVGNFRAVAESLQVAALFARDLGLNIADAIGVAADLSGNAQRIAETMRSIDWKAEDVTVSFDQFATIAGAALGIMSNIVNFINKANEASIESQRRAREHKAAEYDVNMLLRERLKLQLDINEATIQGLQKQIALNRQLYSESQADVEKLKQSVLNFIAMDMFDPMKPKDEWEDEYKKLLDGGTDAIKDYITGHPELMNNPLIPQFLEMTAEVDGFKEATEQAEEALKSLMTGTDIQSLGDQIVSAFEEGKDSIYEFGQTFEDVMRNAIMSQIQARYLAPMIEQFFNDMSTFDITGGKGEGSAKPGSIGYQLTWDDLKEEWTGMGTKFKNITDGFFKGLGIEGYEDQINSFQGAIKGVTEETAGIIAGQMTAIRIHQAESLMVIREQLMYLSRIASHTEHLKSIDNKLTVLSKSSWREGGQID